MGEDDRAADERRRLQQVHYGVRQCCAGKAVAGRTQHPI